MRTNHFKLAFGLLICVGLMIAVAVPVIAHHAFGAEFDPNLPVLMKGCVTKVEWVNPHTWIHVQGAIQKGGDEGGDESSSEDPCEGGEIWAFEAGTPNTLLRRGLNRDSLVPGTIIIVDGYQSKDRSNRANGRDITFEDGSKIFMGSSANTGAPYDKKGPRTRNPNRR